MVRSKEAQEARNARRLAAKGLDSWTETGTPLPAATASPAAAPAAVASPVATTPAPAPVKPAATPADKQLKQLAELRDQGVLTDELYDQAAAKVHAAAGEWRPCCAVPTTYRARSPLRRRRRRRRLPAAAAAARTPRG